MHVGIAYLRWRGKRSRHSRRMRTCDFAYLARGPWASAELSEIIYFCSISGDARIWMSPRHGILIMYDKLGNMYTCTLQPVLKTGVHTLLYFSANTWEVSLTCSYINSLINLFMVRYSSTNNISFKKLTHWGWVTHICAGNLTIIGLDNGLSPGRRQAII